jgi:hemerythrin-like domain-containing protein
MIQIGAPSPTIDSPIEHLFACHRRIEQRLDTLVNAADHVAQNLPAAKAAIAASLDFLDNSGVLHTRDEEDSLFPRLRPKLTALETSFLDSLESQHGYAEAICVELKSLYASFECSGFDVAAYRACASRLRAFYRAHIRAEDETLTAIARRSLDHFDLTQITQEMRSRRSVHLRA